MHQSKLVILYSIGMVKSPVEGNSIVLLKLDQPIVFSDFARPVCIPDQDESDQQNSSQDNKCGAFEDESRTALG